MSKTVKLIFTSLTINSFANALISVFVPIFLIQHGYSLAKIVFVFLIYSVSKLAVNYGAIKFIIKRGSRLGLALSYIANVIALIILNVGLAQLNYPLIVASFAIAAWSDAFQWNSQHLHLSELLDKARKSNHLALLSNSSTVLGILAPLIGGFLAGFYGSTLVLAIASIIGLFAILPLYWQGFENSNQHEIIGPYNLKSAPIKDLVANAAWNTETAIAIFIWPMYVYIFIGQLQDIGLLVALGSFLTIIVVYLAGRRGDKINNHKVINEGAVISSIFHLVRAFAYSTATVIIGDLGYKISQKYMEIGWISTYYGHAQKPGMAYINSMEIAGDIARLIMWIMVWCVALTVPSGSFYRITFVLAAIITMFCMLMSKEGQPIKS